MERLSDAELERMHASVNRLRAAVVDARWDIDRPVTAAFNNVARITGSPMPLRMMADLHEQSRSYRALLEDRMARPTPIREGEHLDDMWRAVAARDVATVRRLHRVHLEKVAEWVVGQLPESA
jgi:DNA-binding GntR family transcriptional regulator